MPRPRRMSTFGKFLAQKRAARRLTAEQVVRQLQRYGVQLDSSTLYNYEAGTVASPDGGAMWALAKIYGLDIDALFTSLNHTRAGIPGDHSIPESPPGGLSEREWKMLQKLRLMTPAAQRLCYEFIEFQAERGGVGDQQEQTQRPPFRDAAPETVDGKGRRAR